MTRNGSYLFCYHVREIGSEINWRFAGLEFGLLFLSRDNVEQALDVLFGVIWILAGGRWRKALKEGGPGGGQGIFGSDENGVILDR